MQSIGCAVVGCGAISPVHIEALAGLEGVRLAALCDNNPEALQKAARKAEKALLYADFNRLLENSTIQAVHLCVPHHLHAPMAKAALQRGIHVLTEKPMGRSLQEAMEIAQAAKTSQALFGVCFQNRYRPLAQETKKRLDSGMYGKLLGIRAYLAWRRDAAYYRQNAWRGKWSTEGGGVMINQAIHTLDLALYLGGPAEKVSGSLSNHTLPEIEVEDTAELRWTFANGAVGLMHATNASFENAPPRLEIVCEQACLILAKSLHIEQKENFETIEENASLSHNEHACWGSTHKKLIADFYRSIQERRPFAVDAEEGLKSMQALEALYQKARS